LSWSLLVKLARTFVPGTSAVVEDVVVEVSEP
jgi:VanZ family protein